MNWRTPVCLAATLVALVVARFLWTPAGATDALPEALFQSMNEEYIQIEIQPAEKPEVILERRATGAGPMWFIRKPVEKPAWEPYVLDMLGGLRQLTTANAVAADTEGYGPDVTGLASPELVVRVQTSGGKRTLRFGRPLTKDPSQRWFVLEGDARLFFGSQRAFDPFLRPVKDLRHRGVVLFAPARVQRIELQNRGEVATLAGGRPVVEVRTETSVFERRGIVEWIWVRPGSAEEQLSEDRVNLLLSGLANLLAEDFVPLGDPAAHGLDKPEVRVRLTMRDPPEEAELLFGKTVAAQERKLVHLALAGGDEAAVVDAERLQDLPLSRNLFRRHEVFDFGPGDLTGLEVACDLGKVVLERGEVKIHEEKRPGWILKEPADVPLEAPSEAQEALDRFVAGVLRAEVLEGDEGFIGSDQPDLKLYGLDPPKLTLTVRLNLPGGPELRAYRFGYLGTGDKAYVQRPGSDEILGIAAGQYRLLERMDLNFRSDVVFSVPVESIAKVSVDLEDDRQIGRRQYYYVGRDRDGRWAFLDSENKGDLDHERMRALLRQLNHIKASSFVSRRPDVARDYGLHSRRTAGKVEIIYEGGSRVLKLSRPLRIAGTGVRRRYGLFEGDSIVFIVPPELVESLEIGVLKEKEGDPGTNPDEEDH